LQQHVIAAKREANPCLKIHEGYLRRYRNQLYYVKLPNYFFEEKVWLNVDKILVLSATSSLHKVTATKGISKKKWHSSPVTIKYRRGGEKIKLPARKGHHSLKKLFQEANIPPWERDKIPLVYFKETLVAIADLWISAEVFESKNTECYLLKWRQ
jgi:tRNA(Ile)-lysidine synthase